MNRPIHFEILADDPEKLSVFYEEVFGWKTAAWGGGDQGYWLVTTGPADVPGIDGGMMNRHFEQAVINTVEVADIERVIEQVVSLGGMKKHGPQEVPGIGLHAYLADPEGNLFGVLQPAG